MLRVEDTLEDENYDEFGLLHENAEEMGLDWDGRPQVERGIFEAGVDQELSMIRWGGGDPEFVFLHGGGQNAHTWDSLALALGRPMVCFDLPGHGRSYRRQDRNYGPWENAEVLSHAIAMLAPNAKAVVGMSLGGATTIRLAAEHPERCRRAVLVDVTPQINDPSRPINDLTRSLTMQERGTVALVSQDPVFSSFEEMADAAVALSPFRASSGVRRGVRHNAFRRSDGQWQWRYDLFGARTNNQGDWSDFTPLWNDLGRIHIPTMLVIGGESKFVLSDDVDEMRRRIPSLRVQEVAGAGHAVQSDQPRALARLLEDFVV